MDIDDILNGKIIIEGDALPTLREIIEKHFANSAEGNAAFGKMISAQYIAHLTEMVRGSDRRDKAADSSERCDKTAQEKPASSEKGSERSGQRAGSDTEAVMKSMGVPLTADGRIDILGAFAGAMTPEGSKTPLGTIISTVMRNVGENSRPRT